MNNPIPKIWVVDDSPDDQALMKRALKIAAISNPVVYFEDGSAVISSLKALVSEKSEDLPALVFLDLNMPGKSGHDVLEWIRERRNLQKVVVIVLTTSDQPFDLQKAYRLGANSYLVKPASAQQLVDLINAFKWYWLQFNRFPPATPESESVKAANEEA